MAVVSINEKEHKIENIAIYKLAELESTSKSRRQIMEEYSSKSVFFISWFGGSEEGVTELYSLTESISSKEQIRYVTHEDHAKYIDCFFREYIEINNKKKIEIRTNHPFVDPAFLEKISEFDLDIHITPLLTNSNELYLTSQKFMSQGVYNALEILLKGGFSRLAISIFRNMENSELNSDVNLTLLVAHAYLMSGDVFSAEWHYNKVIESAEDPLTIAWALYSKSMIYIRHHERYAKDVSVGKKCLQDAYDILLTNSYEKESFPAVFNRNGYALVQFIEGDIDEAICFLKHGIELLLRNPSQKYVMHASVLQYNVVQCYMREGLIDESLVELDKLIEMDPNQVEYLHLKIELLIQSGKEKEIQEIYNSLLNYRHYYPEIVIEYFDNRSENVTDSMINECVKFFELPSIEYKFKLDFLYSLMDCDYHKANEFVSNIDIGKIKNKKTRIYFHLAKAEVIFNISGSFQAEKYLLECEFSTSPDVLQSISLIKNEEENEK